MSREFEAEMDRLLRAASAEIDDFGFQRTSIQAIAQRAGVSRPTVYRRFGGKNALLQAYLGMVARTFWSEWTVLDPDAVSVAERAGDLFVIGMRTARTHPGVGRLLKENPELVVNTWADTDNRQLIQVREDIARALDPARTLDEVLVRRAADLLQRIGLSYLATPSELFDERALRAAVVGAVSAATQAG